MLNDKFSLWKVCSYNFIHYSHIHPFSRLFSPSLVSFSFFRSVSVHSFSIFHTKLILFRFTRNVSVTGRTEGNSLHCQLPCCSLRALNGRKADTKESLKNICAKGEKKFLCQWTPKARRPNRSHFWKSLRLLSFLWKQLWSKSSTIRAVVIYQYDN